MKAFTEQLLDIYIYKEFVQNSNLIRSYLFSLENKILQRLFENGSFKQYLHTIAKIKATGGDDKNS